MPKRRTRLQSTKAKPKLSEDHGAVASMSEAERKAKVKVFLQDFDEKVKVMRHKQENQQKELMRFIEKTLMYELSAIPTAIRNMTLEEFIECGGTFNAASSYCMEKDDHVSNSVLLNSVSSSRLKSKMSRLNPQLFDAIAEEEDSMVVMQTPFTQPKTVLGKGRKNGRTPLKDNNKFVTPAFGRSMAATGWATPLITPKFDPRLPLTQAQQRQAKPGEVIMSLGGSPILNANNTNSTMKKLKKLATDVELPSQYRDEIDALYGKIQDFVEKAKK